MGAESEIRAAALRSAVALAAALTLGGCGTLRQDILAIGESIMPVSPPEAVRMMVDPHDPDNRRRGTVLIANSPFGGSDPYLAMYRDRAQHETDPLVKAVSARALGRHGQPADALLLAALLDEDHFQVRWEAAKALQRLHNPEVTGALLKTLRDPDEQPKIRVAAATALGQYPQDRVVQVLVRALDATALSVDIAARDSLTTLTGQDFGLDPAAWLKWYNDTDDPFAGRREYLYPTYQRQETWLEKLAFWSSSTFEQPAPPAGLRSRDERRTYEDDPATDEAGTGG